jgi:hypothetical protein
MIHRCARPSGSLIGSSIQNGGSARGYQAIFVPSAALGIPGYDGQPAVYSSPRLRWPSSIAA